MADGTQSPENSFNPHEIKTDRLQFADGHLAVRVKGSPDAQPYDLNDEKITHNPVRSPRNEAIIKGADGNDFYIAHDQEGGTYVVDTRASYQGDKLVAVYTPPEKKAQFPAVEWGKPMKLGRLETSAVQGLLLSDRSAAGKGDSRYPQVNSSSPFEGHRAFLSRHLPQGKPAIDGTGNIK